MGSLLCGLAPNLPLLIVFRAVQGIGGGIALPLGTALLLQAFPHEEQGMALGIFGVAALVAPAAGPILGGWLVVHNEWRLIFYLNPPIGLVGVLLGLRFLRENRYEVKPSFDLNGVIAEVIGFGSILYAASVASNKGWGAAETILFFVIGGVGLVVFGVIELFYAKEPLLDLRLFKNRVFLNASLLGYVSTIALFGAEFLLPIYLQALRGQTALQTGFILLPMALSGGIFVTISGRLYDRLGPRPLMIAGFILLMVNTWQLALIRADTPISWILFLLVLRGVALGLTVQTTMVTALSVVPVRDLARGSSLTNATRNVVQSIGVAVLATVLASAISPQVRDLQNQFDAQQSSPSQPVGICEVAASGSSAIPNTGGTPGAQPSVTIPPQVNPLVKQACAENITGFERAYKVTFYAAGLALILGALLPGWPGPWSGRKSPEPEPPAYGSL